MMNKSKRGWQPEERVVWSSVFGLWSFYLAAECELAARVRVPLLPESRLNVISKILKIRFLFF